MTRHASTLRCGRVACLALVFFMAFTYNNCDGSQDNIDLPRLLVDDTIALGHIWEDSEIMGASRIEQIAVFGPGSMGQPSTLVNVTPSPRLVAATLLMSLASNKARLANAIKVLDVAIDTKTAGMELRAAAQALRDAEKFNGAFAVVEMVPNEFSMRERFLNQMLRNQSV